MIILGAEAQEQGPALDPSQFPQEIPLTLEGMIESIFRILRDITECNLPVLEISCEETV